MPLLKTAALLLLISLTACSQQESAVEETGDSPLLIAAESGDLPAISKYTAENSDINVRDACLWTPLMKAALNGHTEAARKLIEAGADVNLLDKGGYSALMLAASNNHHEIVDLLLNSGANPNQQELTEGFTAMIWAAKLGHVATVKLLLNQGADQSFRDKDGKSALDWSREMEHGEITALLSD